MKLILCFNFIYFILLEVLSVTSEPFSPPNFKVVSKLIKPPVRLDPFITSNTNDIKTLTQIFDGQSTAGRPKIPSSPGFIAAPNRRRPVTLSKNRVDPPRPLQLCGKRSVITFPRFKRASPNFPVAAPKDSTIFPIAGGVDAIRNSWPWMVLLGEREGNGARWFCDGVLINKQWVLTAAHCIDRKLPDVVRLGEHDYSTRSDGAAHKDYTVSSSKFYTGYRAGVAYHDLALLKLNTPVKFSSSISPVCLPWGVLTDRNLEGSSVDITGWGALEFGGLHHPILQEARVIVNKTTDCDRAFKGLLQYSLLWPKGITKATTLCAAADGKDACRGDSGGPAVSNVRGYYVLAGIVSKGYGCANSNYPGIYVNINQPHYLNWIKSTAFA